MFRIWKYRLTHFAPASMESHNAHTCLPLNRLICAARIGLHAR